MKHKKYKNHRLKDKNISRIKMMHYSMRVYCTIQVFNKIRLLILRGLRKSIRASLSRNLKMTSIFRNMRKRVKVKILLMSRTNKLK